MVREERRLVLTTKSSLKITGNTGSNFGTKREELIPRSNR